MFEILLTIVAALFVSRSDGSRLIASCFCGLLPLCLSLIEAKENKRIENKEGILSLWTIFGLLFVLNFISAMVCVRNSVTARDLESLLVDSMSLLCTGVTSAHALLYWLYQLPKTESLAIEQCSALLFYLMLLSGVNQNTLCLGFQLAMISMSLTLAQGQAVFCNSIAVMLAFRMEELFWCEPLTAPLHPIIPCSVSPRELNASHAGSPATPIQPRPAACAAPPPSSSARTSSPPP
jgi:hypothetical protein